MTHTGLERRINNISKAAGGGKVVIELPAYGHDTFFARVYPSTNKARELLAAGGGSMTLESLSEAVTKLESSQLEYGRGANIEEAVAALAAKFKETK